MFKKYKFAVLLSFLLLVAFRSAATGFFCRIHDFASANGLLEAHMSNAVQDEDGFMWFATWNGLVRYDGYNYNTFKPVQNSCGTISSNRIFNIKKTRNGNLWCLSSDNNLYLFDAKESSFINMHAKFPAIKVKKVKKLFPLKKGVTWIVFRDNSCLRLVDSSPFHGSISMNAGSRMLGVSKEIYGVVQDSIGREWILTDKAAFQYKGRNRIGGKYKYVVSHRNYTWLVAENGRTVLVQGNRYKVLSAGNDIDGNVNSVEYAEGKLYFATSKGVYFMNGSSSRRYALSGTPSDYLYRDSKGRVWSFPNSNSVEVFDGRSGKMSSLASVKQTSRNKMKNPQLIYENAYGQIIVKPQQGELSFYDEQASVLRPCRYYASDTTPIDFHPGDITKYLVDHNKNLWVFQKHQAFCVSFHPDNFLFYNNPSQQECRMLGLDAWGNVWASDRSLSLYQTSWNGVERFLLHTGQTGASPVGFFRQPAYSFMTDSKGRIWVGTKGDGLYILERGNSGSGYSVAHFLHDKMDKSSLCSDSIYAIFQDKRKRIWLGTYGSGVLMAREKNGKWTFERVKCFGDDIKVRCFCEPQRDVLLVGTTNGLLSADVSDMERVRVFNNSFRKESWGLKGNDVMSIVECDGKVYLCVFGSGISEVAGRSFLSSNLHFATYPLSPDVIADQVKSAVCVGHYIWVVSDQSITKFNVRNKSLMTFDRSFFTEAVSFSEASPVVKDGYIIVGTRTGIMMFSSSISCGLINPHKLVFTGIQYTNDMEIRPLNDIDTLFVSPDRRSFSLYVSALDYGGIKPMRFRYRLEGYGEGWNYTGENQHSVNYNNLPPGKYRLIVETTDMDGIWGVARRVIPVVVTPRFVETLYFRLFVAVVILGFVVALIYAVVYLSRIRKSLQRKYSLLMTVDELTADIKREEKIALKEEEDKGFLEANIRYLEDNISKDGLTVENFARHLGMSRTAYYNRMKELTGLSPIEFIRQIRIKKALRLMDDGETSITEVAYKTGFNDPKYFSRCFKAEMGMSPSAYLNEKDKK